MLGAEPLRQLQGGTEQVQHPGRHVQVRQPRMGDVPGFEVLRLRIGAGDEERVRRLRSEVT